MNERLYTDLAHLWPVLSPPEHYEGEAEVIRGILREKCGGGDGERRPSILELGAGGGHTLVHLQDEFDCMAVDLSRPMLDNCRKLCPNVDCVVGDMRDVRLGRTFDAVLIHDAIDYLLTSDDVEAALATAAVHLNAGGMLILAPTYTTERFVDGDVADDGTTGGDHSVTYFSYVHDPDPNDTTVEMILLYLIRDPQTRTVEVIEDRHTCGLFSTEQWLDMIASAGFTPGMYEASEDEPDWPHFVAVRR